MIIPLNSLGFKLGKSSPGILLAAFTILAAISRHTD
jgi:hypothetical protein